MRSLCLQSRSPAPRPRLLALLAPTLLVTAGLSPRAWGTALPDLVPEVLAVSPQGTALALKGRVLNVGSAPYRGGDSVVVTGDDGVDHYLVLPPIEPDRAYVFDLTLRAAQPSGRIRLSVDPLSHGSESSVDNNVVVWERHPPLDLVVGSVRTEGQPEAGQPVFLVADLQDRLWTPAVIATVQATVQVTATLGLPGGEVVAVDVAPVYVKDLLGSHPVPLDLRLPTVAAASIPVADRESTASGSLQAQATAEVTVCAVAAQGVIEVEDSCDGRPGCNNCATVSIEDLPVLLFEPEPEPEPVAEPEPEPEPVTVAEPAAVPAAVPASAQDSSQLLFVWRPDDAASPTNTVPVAASGGSRSPLARDVKSPVLEVPAQVDGSRRPDLVVTDVHWAEPDSAQGLADGAPGTLVSVEVQDLQEVLGRRSGTAMIELREVGSPERGRAELDLSQLASGPTQVQIDAPSSLAAARCTVSGRQSVVVSLAVSLSPVDEELNTLNNLRILRLELPCGPALDSTGGPRQPDLAVVAASPYVVDVDGQDYVRFAVELANQGSPLKASAVELAVAGQSGALLPSAWRARARSKLLLEPRGERLSGPPPRMTTVCGVGGRFFPLRALASQDQSVDLVVSASPIPAGTQLDPSNDSVHVMVPIDGSIPRREQSICGLSPALLGAAPGAARAVVGADMLAPQGTLRLQAGLTGAVDAATEHSPVRVRIVGQVQQSATTAVGLVDYQWLRDGVWAGGGWLELHGAQPKTVTAWDAAGSTALWELLLDPDGLASSSARTDPPSLRLRPTP